MASRKTSGSASRPVQGQIYFLRVFGATNAANNQTAINVYNITVTNEEPPVPYDLELNDIIEVGVSAAGGSTVSVPTTSINQINTTAGLNPALAAPTITRDYIGKRIEFTTGTNAGRRATITGFAAGTFTVGPGLIAAPAAGDTFIVESTDTGRSQFDDVTRDNTPILLLRVDDDILLRDVPGDDVAGNPVDENIPIPFNPSQLAVAANVPGSTSPAGYRVAVFDEGAPQQTGGAPQTPIGYARQLMVGGAAVPGVYVFDFAVDALPGTTPFILTDGSHFLSAKVEIIDPSTGTSGAALANDTAFGARSESLEVVVDTVVPTAAFGDPTVVNDGLHPDSDSGVAGIPATFVDRITNDVTPTFFGRAEANSVVRAYVDSGNPLGTAGVLDPWDILIGQTVAVPTDGTNQFPWGEWEITSTVNMNDPNLLPNLVPPQDGQRTIFVTAEDVAGNVTPNNLALALNIFVDTQGPQITNVQITGSPAYNLFAVKPSNAVQGYTPLVHSLTVSIQDLPARTAAFLYNALAENPPGAEPFAGPDGIVGTPDDIQNPAENSGHYLVVGDANGIIPILDIVFAPNTPVAGLPATGTITIHFNLPGPDGVLGTADDLGAPLPDDRFTLTIRDEIVDPAGNQLDGDSNANEPPNLGPQNPFITGDGQPGGDFVGRFNVDSRAEIAVWGGGNVWVDTNGNYTFDPTNVEFVNRDIVYALGFTNDDIFSGDFGPQTANGREFDMLAAYGKDDAGNHRWLIDTDNNGVPNLDIVQPGNIVGRPVAGEFDGNPANGDEVALFNGTTWFIDTDHDFNVTDAGGSATVTWVNGSGVGLGGFPIVGDWNNDGIDDLGAWREDVFLFGNGLSTPVATARFGYLGANERPVAADFDGDGADDVGLWIPQRPGVVPEEQAEWNLILSNFAAGGVLSRIVPDNDPVVDSRLGFAPPKLAFNPIPFGPDIYAQFGDDFAVPVVGNFDPPLGPDGEPIEDAPLADPGMVVYDLNSDTEINTLDLALMLGDLRNNHPRAASEQLRVGGAASVDINRDGSINTLDLASMLGFLRNFGPRSVFDNVFAGGESEPVAEGEPPAAAAIVVSAGLTAEGEPAADDAPSADTGSAAQTAAPAVDAALAQASAAVLDLSTDDEDEAEGFTDLEDVLDSIADDIAGGWAE